MPLIRQASFADIKLHINNINHLALDPFAHYTEGAMHVKRKGGDFGGQMRGNRYSAHSMALPNTAEFGEKVSENEVWGVDPI